MIHTHPFNGPLSGTTWVSRYRKGKTNLDFIEARDSEWQWHQLPAPHCSVFTGWMPFLPPNQQCQSTEGLWKICDIYFRTDSTDSKHIHFYSLAFSLYHFFSFHSPWQIKRTYVGFWVNVKTASPIIIYNVHGWLGSWVVSMLHSGTEVPGFKAQPRRCQVTVFGKLFTPIMPLFTEQRNL